jgi:hypothetical protein
MDMHERMPMNAQPTPATSYLIETSGWDANQDYFVEQNALEWAAAEKRIRLQHQIRPGTILFIRLLGTAPMGDSCPVAHEAVEVKYAPESHSYLVHLAQVLPRTRTTAGDVRIRSERE